MVGTELAVGQVWTYRTRVGEESSRAIILKIEEDEHHGAIVHVSVEGVSIRNPPAIGGVTTAISHLPYEESALRESLRDIVDVVADVNLSGYADWKVAFDAGEAGVWTVPLADAVAFTEEALGQAYVESEAGS